MAADAELKALTVRLEIAVGEIGRQLNEVYAVIDELEEMTESPAPEPSPELILSRSNVTAVETLPAGALLGCRMITMAVTFDGPPGTRPEKLISADSTKNSKGGMCMERRPNGDYSVWVQADGTQSVQLPLDNLGPMFLTSELPEPRTVLAIQAEPGELHGFNELPCEPDPFDGAVAILAGYWNGKLCDPAKATIHELRAYKGWSQAQLEHDRAAWATLFPDA